VPVFGGDDETRRSSRMGRTSLMAFQRVLRQTSKSSARGLRPQTRRR
jgi:hypothetical protein